MYNFVEHFEENEEILYQSKGNPGKGGKNVISSTLIIIFSLLMQFWIFTLPDENTNSGTSVLCIFLLIIELLLAYDIIYKLFLKDKVVGGYNYCITNKKVYIYDEKTKKLMMENIIYYIDNKVTDVKDNFGDVVLKTESLEDAKKHPNKTYVGRFVEPGMRVQPILKLESIENPNEVLNLIENTKKDLLS